VLEQVRRRYRFVVVGYVVMPEHVHLLISEPEREIHRVLVNEVQKATLQVRPRAVVPTLRKPRRVGNLLSGDAEGGPAVGDFRRAGGDVLKPPF
jgi:REP element-mobilizing transposase RayT